MAITTEDLTYYYSGGTANSDPNASLGGAISSTEWAGGTLHDLFDVITGDENAAATVDYRCVYVKNDHGSLSLIGAVTYLSAVVAGGADVAIGIDPAGVNGTATTIADEETAPAGVSFSAPESKGAGISIGDIPAGQYQAIWIRRTATDSPALDNDGATLEVEGDSTE